MKPIKKIHYGSDNGKGPWPLCNSGDWRSYNTPKVTDDKEKITCLICAEKLGIRKEIIRERMVKAIMDQ